MKTLMINLDTFDKAKSFVNDVSKFDTDFDLVQGRYLVDGKSIMGTLSLKLTEPIELNIHATDQMDEIIEKLACYIVEE